LKSSILGAIGFALVAPLLSGCATTQPNIYDDKLDHVHITPGRMEYHMAEGNVVIKTFPAESPIDIKDGVPKTYNVGVPKEIELGWDMFGLKPRPMIMIRTFYVGDFGGCIGADENAFITGLDWRYKDVLIGPLVGVPWLDPSKTIFGGKVAVPLSW